LGLWSESVRVDERDVSGFTILELLVVVAIIAVLAAMAMPNLRQWQANKRLQSAALDIMTLFSQARSEAIRTGNVHILFLQTDAAGNALFDAGGAPVPALVLDDGAPGSVNQNCQIDAGEPAHTISALPGVAWGVSDAAGPAPFDAGTGDFTAGASFTEPDGDPAGWVMFRPDGLPLAFDAACNTGALGSGAGGVYVTNGVADYAAVLSPLGSARIHGWEQSQAQWSN
jgi:prepilin-type N-terminal cleavage/methylation domain-containing protein